MTVEASLFVVALGAVVAGFVQGLSGFAFGMTAMSFWAWTLDPALAAVLTVFGSLTGQLIAAVTGRRGWHLQTLWPFLAGGLLGIPIGVAILPLMDAQWFKAVFGAFLMLWCPAMLMAGRWTRLQRVGRWADGLAGSLGGVMGGLGGFTGTIPTLWCTLRGFGKDEQRSIIQNFNLAALTVTMAAYLARGLVTPPMLPMLGVVAVAMLVPTVLGNRLYVGLSEAAFRRLVLGLLTASGLALLVSSIPGLLRR